MSDSVFAFGFAAFSPLLAQAADAAQKNNAAADGFFNSGWFAFILLIATLFLGWLLAKLISSSLRLPEYRTRLMMAIIPIMLGVLLIVTGWPPKFGVDLRGGINMVGSLNLANQDDADPVTAEEIIDQLNKRVNPSGTLEIVIRPLGDDKIEVTIPDVNEAEADNIWKLLVSAGKLEFRIVADTRFHPFEIDAAKAQAKDGERSSKVTDKDGKTIAFWIPLAKVEMEEGERAPEVIPFKYTPQQSELIRDRDTGDIVQLPPFGGDGAALAEYCAEQNIRPQILMIQPSPDQDVVGSDLAAVSRGTDQKGRPMVEFKTTAYGSAQLGMLTGMNKPEGENKRLLGIVIDDKLHSAPSINGQISSQGVIEGEFTVKEIDDLVTKLKSGKMKAALNKNPISKNFIESLLGQELRQQGIFAISISLALVLGFMIFYYRFAGIIAAFALAINILLILAIVMAIKQPLTLTGLAGLVLTVGMAVDANVLIFERIREEMDRGSTLRMAIRNGFDKARTTIVDANVTTLITALVLYTLGTEQVKGFAVTLILGIVISMFTAIFCSRIIFDIAERKRWISKLNMTRILQKKKFDFISKIAATGVISAILIGTGIAGMFFLGAKILDHDLRGGSTVRMVFKEKQDIDQIRETLEAVDMSVRGEEIEFSVAGFSSESLPEAEQGRTFKVDSNLPAWEGGDEAERWDQLDELMEKTFPGMLVLHNAEIVSGTGSGSTTNAAPENESSHILPRKFRSQNASWSPAVSAISLANPTMLLQDAGGETTTTESADAEPQGESDDSTESDPAKPEPESDTQQTEEDTLPGGGGDFEIPDAGAETARNRSATTETVVKIDPPILGKSLRSEVMEAARSLELGLEDSQLILLSPDILEGENADGTVSENWTIKLENISREEDGAAIINAWTEAFNKQAYFPTSSKVGSQIAKSMRLDATLAIIFSLLGIIAYIWARFQNIAFGLAAVIALLHDVLFVLGMIALSHYVAGALGFLGIDTFKISLEIIAALLTVIGYSLNDTIVVFDRIREVRGKRKQITADMINTSISQTLSRTILTSATTFVVVFILYCFGGDAIHGFAFSLVIGVIVGTYSSIFIASPALLWLMNTIGLSPEPVEKVADVGQV